MSIKTKINSEEVICATPFFLEWGVEEAAAQPSGSLSVLYMIRQPAASVKPQAQTDWLDFCKDMYNVPL